MLRELADAGYHLVLNTMRSGRLEKDAVKLSSLDGFPDQLRDRIFYECIGMEFVDLFSASPSLKIENELYELLDNEIKKFKDDTYIRGC